MAYASNLLTKWPGPVTFDDHCPVPDSAKIHLTLPNLKTSHSYTGYTATNADITIFIEDRTYSITIKMHDGDTYRYFKIMPSSINEDWTHFKVRDGRIELLLRKVNKVSWKQYANYLIHKPQH